MEPFSIICKSCAAKLKVTKASAVGQILACPKCGTMVPITAPEGWVDDSQDSIAASQDSIGSMGNFEDIDDILANPAPPSAPTQSRQRPVASPRQTRAPQTRSGNTVPKSSKLNTPAPVQQTRQRKTPQPQAPAQQAPARQTSQPAPDPTGSGPIIPNDQWASEDTKRRRRAVMTIAGILGLFLMMGAATVAILVTSKKPNGTPVAQLADQNADVELGNEENGVPDEPLIDEPIDDKKPEGVFDDLDENDDRFIKDDPTDRELIQNDAPKELKKPKVEPQIAKQGRELPMRHRRPQPMAAKGQLELVSDDFPLAADQPNDNQQNQAGGLFDSIDKGDTVIDVEPNGKTESDIPILKKPSGNLGDLAALLQDSGTSLNEIKDIASTLRGDRPVGLPKYIVERPQPIRLDIEKLQQNIGGLKYDNVPLSKALRSLTAMSGIPITIDANSIATAGLSPDPAIEKLISDVELGAAIDELIKPHGLSKIAHETGVTIGVFHSSDFEEQSHDAGSIALNDPERLAKIIKTLIFPDIWVQGVNPATITTDRNKIKVNAHPSAQVQIKLLLERLLAANRLTLDANDKEALSTLESRWSSLSPQLSQSPNLKHSLQKDIGTFLSAVQANTGVTILIDWQNVVQTGWNPQTLVPGSIRESSVGRVIEELGKSLSLAHIAIDEKTIVFTTFERAAQSIELEVYPVHELVKAGFQEADILRLVDETLGRQIHRREFEPISQSVILTGPQSVQRQLEASLNRLMNK